MCVPVELKPLDLHSCLSSWVYTAIHTRGEHRATWKVSSMRRLLPATVNVINEDVASCSERERKDAYVVSANGSFKGREAKPREPFRIRIQMPSSDAWREKIKKRKETKITS